MWVIWVVWVICGFLKSIDVLWLWDDFRCFPGNLVEVTLHSAPSDGAADWQNRKTNEIWELLALSRAFPSGGQPRSDFQPWLKMSSELWGDSKFKSYAVMLFWSPQIDSPRVSSAFPPLAAWTAILKPSQGLAGSPSSPCQRIPQRLHRAVQQFGLEKGRHKTRLSPDILTQSSAQNLGKVLKSPYHLNICFAKKGCLSFRSARW